MSAQKRRVGRNDPCSCGSGRKYKHCCQPKEGQASPRQRLLIAAVVVALAGGLLLAISFRAEPSSQTGRVWSPEHGHYH